MFTSVVLLACREPAFSCASEGLSAVITVLTEQELPPTASLFLVLCVWVLCAFLWCKYSFWLEICVYLGISPGVKIVHVSYPPAATARAYLRQYLKFCVVLWRICHDYNCKCEFSFHFTFLIIFIMWRVRHLVIIYVWCYVAPYGISSVTAGHFHTASEWSCSLPIWLLIYTLLFAFCFRYPPHTHTHT